MSSSLWLSVSSGIAYLAALGIQLSVEFERRKGRIGSVENRKLHKLFFSIHFIQKKQLNSNIGR